MLAGPVARPLTCLQRLAQRITVPRLGPRTALLALLPSRWPRHLPCWCLSPPGLSVLLCSDVLHLRLLLPQAIDFKCRPPYKASEMCISSPVSPFCSKCRSAAGCTTPHVYHIPRHTCSFSPNPGAEPLLSTRPLHSSFAWTMIL